MHFKHCLRFALLLPFGLAFPLLSTPRAAAQTVVATDDFEAGTIGYNSTTGTGLGALTYLAGTPGGPFAANAGSGGRQIAGTQSLGIFSGGGTQEAGLPLAGSTTVVAGVYSFSARFDLDNATGTSAFNIKSGLGTSFAANQLVSFGLAPASGNNAFFVTDSTGTHTLNLGAELRGPIVDFQLSFNTSGTGAYTLGARFSGAGTFTNITGNLIDTNGATAGVGSLAALGIENLNGSTGTQNLLIDSISVVSVPEPSTLAILGIAGIGWVGIFRRKRS